MTKLGGLAHRKMRKESIRQIKMIEEMNRELSIRNSTEN